MSKGFHRLPSDVPWSNKAVPFTGRMAATELDDIRPDPALDAMTTRTAPFPSVPLAEFEPGPPKMDRSQARSAGFTGNSCNECGSLQMVRNGTCEKCNSCGATTGCS